METPFATETIANIITNTVVREREIVLMSAQSSVNDDGELPVLAMLKASTMTGRLKTLETIHNGQYGICLDCGEPIPEKRLAAKLTALRCLECQKEWEKNGCPTD